MKALVFILVSVGMKVWYEKLRERNMPELMLNNIEIANHIRVNIGRNHNG